jgi:hypothetical protein
MSGRRNWSRGGFFAEEQSRETARWMLESLAYLDRPDPEPPRMCRGCEYVTCDPDGVLVCILGHGACPKMPAHLRDSAIAAATRFERPKEDDDVRS